MADQELTNILANLVRANAGRKLPNFNQVSGLSQALLSGQGVVNPYQSEDTGNEDPRGPSVVNRVLDIMSRPLYGVLNFTKGTIQRAKESDSAAEALLAPLDTQAGSDIWQGLSGKAKVTGRDILQEVPNYDEMSGPLKFAAGMTIDTLADPLTYVGGLGLAGRLGRAAKTSTEALRGVEEGTANTARNLADEISRKAAQQATETSVEVPVRGMPAPAPGSPPRVFEAGPGPVGQFETDVRANTAARAAREQAPRPNLGNDLDEPTLVTSRRQNFNENRLPENPAPPPTPSPLDEIKILQKQIQGTKSPVAQNILKQQVAKLSAGVKPAELLSEIRTAPTPFPALSINQRWIDTATEAAQNFLKSNRMQNINHVGQSNLYNKILNAASKVRKDRRAFTVLQMLRVAEDQVLGSGRRLVDAEGISVRLSDVANMMGGPKSLSSKLVDDFRKARPSQQVEDLKAYTTPQVASEILDPVVSTGKELVPYVKTLPPSQTQLVGSELSKELSNIAQKAGASTREASVAKSFIDELFSVDRDKLYSSVQKEARNLVRQSATGILNPQSMYKISEEVYRSLGVNPRLLGRELQQGRVVEGIMTKFATWWGAKDLKPFSREYIDTARNVAAAFSEAIKPLVRATTPSQRRTAFAVAQGKVSAGSPQEAQLAQQFKFMIERLMGTHGITDNAEAVVLRSGTLLKELNKELPETLKLIDTKGTDNLGRAYDYSNGGWMNSWKEWAAAEPAESLYQLTRSLQVVTRKNSMWDDAAARWGMPMKGAEFQYEAAGVDRLKGTYFPQQIANQISNLQSQLERDVFRTPNRAIRLFDQVQRMWKTGVTIYSPSHHIRNLNGDIYLASLDGVVTPRPYAIASRVLYAFPSRYTSLESVFNIMDPQLRDRALRARPGNTVLTTRRGERLTAEQLYQAAESQGLFIRAMSIEDLVGDTPGIAQRFQPFGGRVNDVATRASELRDHWVRLAHFTDVISKSNQPLRVAIEQAGRRVRKFHPDGMDLTGLEQNVLRRVIPFYSWMRKATPLVLEGAIMRPHITLAFPKAMANIQAATGIESQGPGDPFPMDQMFPDWIKEKGIGPVLNPGSGLGRDETWRGESPGYTIINPTNPFIDQIAQLGSPGKSALSALSPVGRIPIELLTGQTSLGIPLENVEGGVPGHLAQQVPAIGIGARLTGMTRDNEPYNPEQLINWLTSAGVTGTGPYQAQAQTEIRQMLTEMAKKNRGDYR